MKNNFTILFLLFVTNCFSQINAFTEEIELPDCLSCDQIKDSNYSELDDSEASKIIEDILELTGFPKVFSIMQCKGAENAFATTINEERFIIYSKEFFNNITNSQGSYSWENVSILAHEIGHHVYGHSKDCNSLSLSKEQQRKMELEADKFMGIAMKRMGASLLQATAAINNLVPFEKDDTYSSHPSKSKRLNAIKQGYNDEGSQKYLINLGEANLYKAIDFYKNGDYRKANEFLSAVIIFGIENDLVYRYKGKTNFAIKNYNDALIDFDKAISFNPLSSQLYIERAMVKLAINPLSSDEFDESAINDLDKAIELNPKDYNAYLIRARDGIGFSSFTETINFFNKAIEIDRNNYLAYYEKAKFIHLGYELLGYEIFYESESYIDSLNVGLESKYFDIGIEAVSKAINLRPTNEILSKLFSLRGDLIRSQKDFIEDDYDYDIVISNYYRCLDIDNKSLDCHYGLGYVKYLLEDYDTAIKYFNDFFKYFEILKYSEQEIIIESELHLLASYYLAKSYGFIDDFENVFYILDRGIEKNSRSSILYFQRAMAKEITDDFYGSIADYERAYELDPEDVTTINNMAYAKEMLNQFEDAIIDYKKVIELDPNYFTAYLNIGRTYLNELEDYDNALIYFLQTFQIFGLKENYSTGLLYSYISQCLYYKYLQNDYDLQSQTNYLKRFFKSSSFTNLEKDLLSQSLVFMKLSIKLLEENKNDDSALYDLDITSNYLVETLNFQGLVYLEKDNYDLALESFNRANKQSSQSDSEVLYNIGRAHWYLDNDDQAIYFLRQSYDSENNTSSLTLIAEIKKHEAKILAENNDSFGSKRMFNSAINEINQALLINKNDDYLYFLLGEIYFLLDDYKKSIENYDTAIRLGHAEIEPMIYHDLAETYVVMGQFYKAIYNYTKTLEILTDNNELAHLYNDIGKVKVKLKDYKGAVKDFRLAIDLDPENVNYINNLNKALDNDLETGLKEQ